MKIKQLPSAVSLLLTVMLLATSAPSHAQQADPEVRARQVLDRMVNGKFSEIEAQYDSAMKSALPPGKLAEVWGQLNDQIGSFKKVTGATTRQISGYEVVTLTCEFQQMAIDTIVSFTSGGQIGGIRIVPHKPDAEWSAPAYVKTDSFREQAVTVESGHWELPGTLTVPAGNGPFPLVVLVHGSGPHDQDETMGPNATFKDLAWGLGSKGVAVLRYVKRTKKYGVKIGDDPSRFTVDDEVINDARAAVDLASREPKIDSKRIYVLGHSLGGYLAPRIASGDAQVGGLIIFAGSARPMEKLVVEQLQYFSTLPGGDSDLVRAKIAAAEQSEKQIESPDLKPGDTVELLGTKITATYFLDLRGYEPTAVAAKLSIPILVMQGGRDYQVRDADFEAWKKTLEGKPTVQFKYYPDVNHLFETGKGMATPAEYDNPGHVAEPVISDMAAWILSNGKSK